MKIAVNQPCRIMVEYYDGEVIHEYVKRVMQPPTCSSFNGTPIPVPVAVPSIETFSLVRTIKTGDFIVAIYEK